MFGFSGLELRLAFYGVLLAAIAGALVYERHSGEAEVHRQDKAAADRQHTQDVATNEGITRELTALRARLASSPAATTGPPKLRVCNPASLVSTGPAAGPAQPGLAPPASGDRGVPGGAQADASVDVGPVVQDLALAGLLRATNGDLMWEWAVKQAQPVR